MKFIFLSLHNLLDCCSHLDNQVLIELTVEVVSLILVDTFDSTLVLLLEVFFNDADCGLLHLFLHDMVLSRSVDLIEELLLSLFKLLLLLAISPRSFPLLLFKVTLE